jgi:hypothetical protein
MASNLSALSLSDERFKNIISDLEEHTLSSEQILKISMVLKNLGNKRIAQDQENHISPSASKRQKLSPSFNPSPKKSGPFGELRPERKTGSMIRNRKNAIYIHTAIENSEAEYIKYEDRINAVNYLKDGGTLHDALLDVETKIRRLIKNNNLLYKRTIYAGLAGDFSVRNRSHKAHINAYDDIGDYNTCASRKIRWIHAVTNRNMAIRASAIIENIDDKYLKTFEVLIGYIFNTTLKGSTVLGDECAYDDIKDYLLSPMRKDQLSAAGLLTVVEDLVAQEENFILGITSPSFPFFSPLWDPNY